MACRLAGAFSVQFRIQPRGGGSGLSAERLQVGAEEVVAPSPQLGAVLPDPAARVVRCCEFGNIPTVAAATLRTMSYTRVVALDGGIKTWREASFPLEPTTRPF